MPRNTLIDLNNHLFAEMERLSDEDLKGDDLKSEIQRSKAIASVASNIINNASLELEAEKFITEYGRRDIKLPEMLENKNGKENIK